MSKIIGIKRYMFVALLGCIIGCQFDQITRLQIVKTYSEPIGSQYSFSKPSGLVLRRVAGELGICLFVADYGNNRIQVISFDKPDSVYTIGDSSGAYGGFNGPINLTVTQSVLFDTTIPPSPDQKIFVADSKNHRILRFDLNGNFETTWGDSGSGDGQFHNPTGIDIDFDGNVYVVDSGNHRIQVFDEDGTFKRAWGGLGENFGQFSSPLDLSLIFDRNNISVQYIAVSDYDNNRVQLLDSLGNCIHCINRIDRPLGIGISGNYIYINEQRGSLIFVNKYSLKIDSEYNFDIHDPYDFSGFFVSSRDSNKVYRVILGDFD